MPVTYRLKMISLILVVITVLYGLQMILILIHLFSVSGFFLYLVIVCKEVCVCVSVCVRDCVCVYMITL